MSPSRVRTPRGSRPSAGGGVAVLADRRSAPSIFSRIGVPTEARHRRRAASRAGPPWSRRVAALVQPAEAVVQAVHAAPRCPPSARPSRRAGRRAARTGVPACPAAPPPRGRRRRARPRGASAWPRPRRAARPSTLTWVRSGARAAACARCPVRRAPRGARGPRRGGRRAGAAPVAVSAARLSMPRMRSNDMAVSALMREPGFLSERDGRAGDREERVATRRRHPHGASPFGRVPAVRTSGRRWNRIARAGRRATRPPVRPGRPRPSGCSSRDDMRSAGAADRRDRSGRPEGAAARSPGRGAAARPPSSSWPSQNGYYALPVQGPGRARRVVPRAPPTRARWCATSRPSRTPSRSCRRGGTRRVATECAEDLAADGVVYAEVRFAPEQHLGRGLSLDAVVEAVLEGFREGERRGRGGRAPERVGTWSPPCGTPRAAARSPGWPSRYRDVGVVGFDIAGAETGYPPTRHLDAFENPRRTRTSPSTPARRSGCRRSGRRSSGAARTGSATACGSSTTSTVGDGRRARRSAGWRRTCVTAASRWRCARPRTSRPARRRRRRAPDRAAARLRFRVTVNTDNRLMSGVACREMRAAARRVRLGLGRPALGHGQRHEERVLPFDKRLRDDRRRDQAGVRRAQGLEGSHYCRACGAPVAGAPAAGPYHPGHPESARTAPVRTGGHRPRSSRLRGACGPGPRAPRPPRPARRAPRPALVAGAVLAVLTVAGAATGVILRRNDRAAPTVPTFAPAPIPVSVPVALPPPPSQPAPSTAPSSAADPEDQLRSRLDGDAATVESLVGKWIPQLSSKREGDVVDGTR